MDDPLEKLLKEWKPSSPHSEERFAMDVMRSIRLSQNESKSFFSAIFEWLPTPAIFLSSTAAILILVVAMFWRQAPVQTRTVAALQWQEEISHPLANVSLAGVYAQLNQK